MGRGYLNGMGAQKWRRQGKMEKSTTFLPLGALTYLTEYFTLGTCHLLRDWATREGRRRAGGGQRAADHLAGADRRWVLNGTRRLDGGNRTKEEGIKETRYPWYLPSSVGRSCAGRCLPKVPTYGRYLSWADAQPENLGKYLHCRKSGGRYIPLHANSAQSRTYPLRAHSLQPKVRIPAFYLLSGRVAFHPPLPHGIT